MLELNGVSRRYGNDIALDDLSFKVSGGEVVGFLGPNGAGKTTAMRAVLGIVSPDSGELKWNGKALSLAARLRFGYMPEERGLYSTMTIIDQLVYLGRLHGMSRDDARASSRHWLSVMGIGDRSEHRLDSLSLGNQQRVQMVAALLHSPELLVLDEPFSGLDPTGIEALAEVLTEQARQGVAVVFSSHQLDLVEGLCERVVIINKGKTVIAGSVEELTHSDTVLTVRVQQDPDGSWAKSLDGVTVAGVRNGDVRLHLTDGTSPDSVLDAARRCGSVRRFTFERKRLSEVFRDAVVS